jgi:hypothetical protein
MSQYAIKLADTRYSSMHHGLFDSVMMDRIRSGVAGMERIRLPMAREMALMIAGVVGSIAASPNPFTP